MQGHWIDEISLWEELLALEPSDQDIASLLTLPLTLGKETSNNIQNFFPKPARDSSSLATSDNIQSIRERLKDCATK